MQKAINAVEAPPKPKHVRSEHPLQTTRLMLASPSGLVSVPALIRAAIASSSLLEVIAALIRAGTETTSGLTFMNDLVQGVLVFVWEKLKTHIAYALNSCTKVFSCEPRCMSDEQAWLFVHCSTLNPVRVQLSLYFRIMTQCATIFNIGDNTL